ncbi:hypothetical protein [Undibacterium sp. TS12]|nr:hypothetical protein [Undibacterium sp. TS12]MCH8620788.1 hypothetical protein [Undibacterium sp. TS12]
MNNAINTQEAEQYAAGHGNIKPGNERQHDLIAPENAGDKHASDTANSD